MPTTGNALPPSWDATRGHRSTGSAAKRKGTSPSYVSPSVSTKYGEATTAESAPLAACLLPKPFERRTTRQKGQRNLQVAFPRRLSRPSAMMCRTTTKEFGHGGSDWEYLAGGRKQLVTG